MYLCCLFRYTLVFWTQQLSFKAIRAWNCIWKWIVGVVFDTEVWWDWCPPYTIRFFGKHYYMFHESILHYRQKFCVAIQIYWILFAISITIKTFKKSILSTLILFFPWKGLIESLIQFSYQLTTMSL